MLPQDLLLAFSDPKQHQHSVSFPNTLPCHEEIMVTLRPCLTLSKLYLVAQADLMQIKCAVHLLESQALSELVGVGQTESV